MKNKNSICIITTTYYPLSNKAEKLRFILSQKTVKKAISSGYDILVIDGGSPAEVISKLKFLGAKVIRQFNHGLGEARRQAFKEGYLSGKDIIIWTEPEKHDIIRHIPKLIKPVIEDNVDLVIPRRKSLSSLPLAQQYIEPFANLFWKTLTNTDFDIYSGIRVMPREIAKHFINYRSKYGDTWDIMVMPIIDLLHDKKKILSVTIDYKHDALQTKSEENNLEFFKKRLQQLNNSTLPLEDYWKGHFNS